MSESQATYRSSMGFLVGLDPGEQTGLALYDPMAGRLRFCTSMSFWKAVQWFGTVAGPVAVVVIEDARKLPVYGRHRAVRGARRDKLARNIGRIDRDTQLWLEYLTGRGYRVVLSHPSARQQKWSAQTFRQITRYQGRTNEHARDAAQLVWGRSGLVVEEAS